MYTGKVNGVVSRLTHCRQVYQTACISIERAFVSKSSRAFRQPINVAPDNNFRGSPKEAKNINIFRKCV